MKHQDSRLTIVIAETAPLIRAGLSVCLKQLPGLMVNTIVVADMRRLMEAMKNYRPDLILANPNFNGAFIPAQIREAYPDVTLKIMAITTTQLDKQTLSLYDGVIYPVDDLDTIHKKIMDICTAAPDEDDDKEQLSQREKEIITLVVKGMTNKEIADKLFLSIHTVNTHRRNIARKLEIHSATGLTIYAIVNRLVDLSDIKL